MPFISRTRRHTSVIRDIWMLQLQLLKRTGSHPARIDGTSKIPCEPLIYWRCVPK